MGEAIIVKDLFVSYQGNQVVQNVSFDIENYPKLNYDQYDIYRRKNGHSTDGAQVELIGHRSQSVSPE